MESQGFNQSPGSVYQHGMGEVLRKGVTHLVIAATPGMCHCPDAPSTKSGIMLNVYDFMKELPPPDKRLVVNDLLFAEYKCPLSETRYDMWTHHNYFVYVIKGKKKWFAGEPPG